MLGMGLWVRFREGLCGCGYRMVEGEGKGAVYCIVSLYDVDVLIWHSI